MEQPTSHFPLLQMFLEPNSCLCKILPLRIGMAVHNQEWSGEAEIVGWLQAAGGK